MNAPTLLASWLNPTVSVKLCLTLAHSLWQMALVAGMAWLAARLVRSTSRQYALHVAALIAGLAALPATYWLVEAPAAEQIAATSPALEPLETTQTAPVADASGSPRGTQSLAGSPMPPIETETPIAIAPTLPDAPLPTSTTPVWLRYAPLLAVVYALGVLAMLARLALAFWHANQLAKSGAPVADSHITELAARLARKWRLRVAPALRAVEQIVVPQVVGLLRPTILLPTAALAGLTPEELEMILAHELAHVKRMDMWVNLLQRLAEAALFFNPALWLLSRRISTLREYCCDELTCAAVAERTPRPQVQYALALLQVVELKQLSEEKAMQKTKQVAALASSGRSPSELRRRVARLFGEPLREPLRLGRGGVWALVTLAAIVLVGPALWTVRAEDHKNQKATSEQNELAGSEAKSATPFVRIRAIDESTGQPIADPEFGIQLGRNNQWHESDGDGSYLAELPSQAPDYCYLKVRAEGYAPMRAFWRNGKGSPRDAIPEEYTFEMAKAITVGGEVVDEQGNPIADAKVRFSAGDDGSHPGRRARQSVSGELYTTDDQGHWRCDVAPPQMDSGSINVYHPDYAVNTANMSVGHKLEELKNFTYETILPRGLVVTGRVTDANGKPVAGAMLATGELNVYDDKGPFVKTDANGRYRTRRIASHTGVELDNARLTITALKPGLAPQMLPIPGFNRVPLGDSTPEERTVNFQLTAGATVRIKLVDSKGEPLAGVPIVPNDWQDTTALRTLSHFGIPSETDVNGVWEWTWAPRDSEIKYDMFKRGYMDIRNYAITADRDVNDVKLVLKRPQVITGIVVDKQTGKPVPEFVVEKGFTGVGTEPGGILWGSATATRAKDGAYRKQITMPPHNGEYVFRVMADGYETAISEPVFFAEGETTVNFALEPVEKKSVDSDAPAKISGKSVLEDEPAAPEEIKLLQELVASYEADFKEIEALHKAGMQGGETADLKLTAYALATARAELAQAEGKPAEAVEHYKSAVAAAEERVAAVQQQYDSGRATLQVVIDGRRLVTEAKLKLLKAQLALRDVEQARNQRAKPPKERDKPEAAEKRTKPDDAKPPAGDGAEAPPADAQSQTKTAPISVFGRALDTDGKPIAGAMIYLASTPDPSLTSLGREAIKLIASTTSDAEGRYRFDGKSLPVGYQKRGYNSRLHGWFEVFGAAEGKALAWESERVFLPSIARADVPPGDLGNDQRRGNRQDRPLEIDLKFAPPVSFHGQIVNDQGEPIPNAELTIFAADSRWVPQQFSAALYNHFPVPVGRRPLTALAWSDIVPDALKTSTSDAQGRFVFTGLPADHRLRVRIRPPGYLQREIWVLTKPSNPEEKLVTDEAKKLYGDDFKLTFKTPEPVYVQVSYGDTGKPAPGALLNAFDGNNSHFVSSDDQGRAMFDLPNGQWSVTATPVTGTPYMATKKEFTLTSDNRQDVVQARLELAAIAEITVIDAETGKPVRGAYAWNKYMHLGRARREMLQRLSGQASQGLNTEYFYTDRAGKMRVPFNAGNYTIGVSAPLPAANNYEPIEPEGRELDLKAGETLQVEFKLRKRPRVAKPPIVKNFEPGSDVAAIASDQSHEGERLVDKQLRGLTIKSNADRLFADAKMRGCDLRDAKLLGGFKAFYQVSLINADLRNAQLNGRAAFQLARFLGANLEQAKLSGEVSGFQQASFNNANLKQARLSGSSSAFQKAEFDNADLTSATLAGGGSSFQQASFDNATLLGATIDCDYPTAFQGVSLNNTDFSAANLTAVPTTSLVSCKFAKQTPPKYSDSTKFPDGFDPQKQGWKKVEK